MLLMMKFIKTRSCDKILRLHFHFVKSYNSQKKRNGTFRNVVPGSCLLRKGAVLYIKSIICWGRALINGAMFALY